MSRQKNRFLMLCAAATTALVLAGTAQAVDMRSWDMKINDVTKRFIVLPAFGSQAVLDKETQLVWQRTPSDDFVSFNVAWQSCDWAKLGGRMGWRLPTLSELRSLMNPAVENESVPSLPAGHPFIGVMAPIKNNGGYGRYWTSTLTTSQDTTYRLAATMNVRHPTAMNIGTALASAWCVRGAASSGE